MRLVIEDTRSTTAQVEVSRGVQQNYDIALTIKLFYSEDPMMYVQALQRGIYSEGFRVGGDDSAEAILVTEPHDALMVRKALAKLDSLNIPNFLGDFCIEQGGYQVLDIKGE